MRAFIFLFARIETFFLQHDVIEKSWVFFRSPFYLDLAIWERDEEREEMVKKASLALIYVVCYVARAFATIVAPCIRVVTIL